VFWLAAGIGLGLTLLGVASSGLVASAMREPEVRELFAVASLCLVLISLTVVPRALLWRQFAYRSLELRDMAATVVGGATAVAVAFAGFGAWAIIVNWLVYSTISLVLVYALAGWRPHLRFSRESARILGAFGAKVSGTVVLNWATLNLDKLLIGRVKGAAALGAYSLAYNVMFLPMTRIALPLASVLLPAYARLQDERERLELGWLRSKRIAVLLLVPCFATTFVVAPDLVTTVFGSKWDEAILPLQLLSVAGVAVAMGTFDTQLLESTGAAGTLLRLTLVISVSSWISFAVGVRWGIAGVAGSYAVVRWALVLPVLWRTTRAVEFHFRSALDATVPPAVFGVMAALAGLAARDWLLPDVPALARLVLTAALTVGLYALLAIAFLRPTVLDLVRTVARRVRRSPD
jgi:O-antigen/teichoic acid export membrane protein